MDIEIKIDDKYTVPKVIVLTDKMDEEIACLIKRLSEEESVSVIPGFLDDTVTVLEQSEISRIYTTSGQVFAEANKKEYKIRLRLYELENRLDPKCFVRISKSEIINLKKVKNFDLSFTGTICVTMRDGTATYVSRRYVQKIKKVLGI